MKPSLIWPLIGLSLLLNAASSRAQTFTALHTFMPPSNTNLDGAGPAGELVLSGSTLYGTSSGGANGSGTNNRGTVFSLTVDGSRFTVLHTFSNYIAYIIGTNSLGFPETMNVNADGLAPRGSLILSGDTLYGAASGGGTNGSGTIFSIGTNGENFTVLHAFATNLPAGSLAYTNADGAVPNSLVLSAGRLYGTTEEGGSNGFGTIFSLNSDGSELAVLHTFRQADGKNPESILVLAEDTLYGTTTSGGNGGLFHTNGSGTIYSISTSGDNFTVLHTSSSTATSTGPYLSGLLVAGDTLFGTTEVGGTNASSAIFSIKTNGSEYREIFYLTNAGNAAPTGTLLLFGDTLYGTSQFNGAYGFGQVFSINTNGANFTTIYSFTKPRAGTNTDGCEPRTGLLLSGASLFGTAYFGGTGNGSVFKLNIAPTITSFHLAGTDLVFAGINGIAGLPYMVLAQTNLALPASQWTAVATNVLSGGGDFSITVTNAANPAAAQQFYRLETHAEVP